MDAIVFAQDWEQSWNNHDLNQIMQHYRDDIVFCSRKAIPLTSSGTVVGKNALKQYWATALDRQPNLKFHVQHVFEGHDMLVISYLNHHSVLAAETLYFDGAGLIFRAAACHERDVN